MKNNSVYDIAKIIMSIMVVCIHVNFLQDYLYPWLRLAVPLFFMFSAYFFFSKVRRSPEKGKEHLKKYVLRNLWLYLIWFVALLPVVITLKPDWITCGRIGKGILLFIRQFIFGGIFSASWFIPACIIGTALVYLISRKANNTVLLVIAFIIYIPLCIRSAYLKAFPADGLIVKAFNLYDRIFFTPYLSFPIAFFWIICGKCFADSTFGYNRDVNVIGLAVSLILMRVEFMISSSISGVLNTDLYFTLVPACIFLFNILIHIKPFSFEKSVYLRNASTIFFVTHKSIIDLLLFKGVDNRYIIFLITMGICTALSVILIFLRNKKPFGFLEKAM